MRRPAATAGRACPFAPAKRSASIDRVGRCPFRYWRAPPPQPASFCPCRCAVRSGRRPSFPLPHNRSPVCKIFARRGRKPSTTEAQRANNERQCGRTVPFGETLPYRTLLAMREAFASRRFFMHPAHQTIGISAGVAAWQGCRELGRPAAEEPRLRRVCLLATATPGDGLVGADARPALAQASPPTARRFRSAANGWPPSTWRAATAWSCWPRQSVGKTGKCAGASLLAARRRDGGLGGGAGLPFRTGPKWPAR